MSLLANKRSLILERHLFVLFFSQFIKFSYQWKWRNIRNIDFFPPFIAFFKNGIHYKNGSCPVFKVLFLKRCNELEMKYLVKAVHGNEFSFANGFYWWQIIKGGVSDRL